MHSRVLVDGLSTSLRLSANIRNIGHGQVLVFVLVVVGNPHDTSPPSKSSICHSIPPEKDSDLKKALIAGGEAVKGAFEDMKRRVRPQLI